jgi:hypothetical protein
MTAADWQPITTAFMGAVGLLLTALIGVYIPQGIAAFQKRTGIQVTAQEQASVYAAAQTAAGIVETQLDQGVLRLQHITPENPVIVDHAKAAIASVVGSAFAQNTSQATMARMIVARVDTAGHPPPISPVELLRLGASPPAPPPL